MAELRKTSIEQEHWHVALLDEAKQMGITSPDGQDKHTHELIYSMGEEAKIDPATGQEIMPAVAEGWHVATAGEKPHTHELSEIALGKEMKPDADGEKEEDIIKDFYDDFRAAKEYDGKNLKQAQEGQDLYCGEHWTEKQREALGPNRAATTINETESKIDALTGYQRQNRSDIRFLPMENGDNTVSDVLTIYWKNNAENMNFYREESKVFLDETVQGRGLFHLDVDFTNNIEGDIIAEKFRNLDCFIGPHEKEDLEDCDFLFKQKTLARRKFDQMYPAWAKKNLGTPPSPEPSETNPKADKRSEDWDGKRLSDEEVAKSLLQPVQVRERWKKEYYRVDVLAFTGEGLYLGVHGLSDAERKKLKSFPDALLIPRILYRMRKTVVAGGTLLNKGEEYPALEGLTLNEFSIIPVYAKKVDEKWWGKVKSIRDLQYLTNKTFSLFVEIIAKCSNYGWFYDNDTFMNSADAEGFQKKASGPGWFQKIKSIGKPPVKQEGQKVPAEIVQMLMLLNTKIREVLNINLEQLGMDSSAQSGIALRQKIAQQLLGNDFLFDSLAQAKKTIGRRWVKLVQLTQNPDRILKVLGEAAAKEPVEIAGQQYSAQAEIPQPQVPGMPQAQALAPMMGTLRDKLQAELFDNPQVVTQDVVVSESPASPSAMMAGYMALMEAAQAGIPVTMDMILAYAPIPNKAKVLQSIQAQQAAAQQADNQKYQTEILKTQIAHQPKPGAPVN